MSPQECGVGTQIAKVKRQSRAPRSKRWLRCIRGLHRTRIVSFAIECCKSDRCYCKITRLRRTSHWSRIRLHSGKIGGRSQIAQNSKFSMSRRMDASSTNGPILGTHWRSCGTYWTKFIRSSVSRIVVGKTMRRSLIRICMGKYQIGNVCSFIENKGFFVSICGWHQKSRKKQHNAPMWKIWMKKRWSWKTRIMSWPCVLLGCIQRECKPNETIIEQYTKMFEPRSAAGATEKYWDGKKLHAKTVGWSYDMKEYARKWVERNCDLANK